LIFHSSTIAMMHGPINIRFTENLINKYSSHGCWRNVQKFQKIFWISSLSFL